MASPTFGIYINPRTPGPEHDVQVIKEVVEQIKLADSYGFSGVWLTEHAFDGQSAYSDPVPLAAYLAGQVKMGMIGFSVAIPPIHNPVRFVTQCAEIDALSDGRLVVGVGTGLGSGEYAGYGADWNARVPATLEAIQIYKEMWQATDGYEHQGEHFNVAFKGRILPNTVQKPYPPFVQATGRADVLRRLGEQGDGALVGAHSPWFLQEKLFGPLVEGMQTAGLPADQQEAILARSGVLHQVYVRNQNEDPSVLEPYFEYFKETFGPNRFRFDEFGPKKNFGRQEASNLPPGVIQAFDNEDSNDFVRHQFSIGTPDEVYAHLAPQIAEGGARHLMCWFNWGVMPNEMVTRSIRLFCEQVMPRLQALTPAPIRVATPA